MKIIIEGPDNSSKTTQIRNIKNYFGNKAIFHTMAYSNVKCDNPKDYSVICYNELLDFLTTSKLNIICDRAHLGEYVYAPLYRNYAGDYIFDIEESYKTKETWNDIVLIMFIADPYVLISREDGFSFSTNIKMKENEIARFINAFNKSQINHKYLIDITDKSEEEVFSQVSNFLSGLPQLHSN